MTSNQERPFLIPRKDDEETAEALVASGYRAIEEYFELSIKRGAHPKGIVLKEVIHEDGVPPLLSADKLQRFYVLAGVYEPRQALKAIGNILKEECGEQRLTPALTLSSKNGSLVVVLR